MDMFEMMVSNYWVVSESLIRSKSMGCRDRDSGNKMQTNAWATILSLSVFNVTFHVSIFVVIWLWQPPQAANLSCLSFILDVM